MTKIRDEKYLKAFGNRQSACLLERIEESHGSPEKLAKYLDRGIEMLFYLEEDTFERREVQNVVSAIRLISNFLREEN